MMVDIEEIYKWLNYFNPSSLSLSALVMRKNIIKEIKAKKFLSAYQIIEYLKGYGKQSIDTLERAEIWAECGLAFYQMGNPYEAMESLKQAAADCPVHSHAQAITHCMLGEVQWNVPSEHDQAMINWEKALEGLNFLEQLADHDHRIADRDWYRERIKELREELKKRVSTLI